MATIKNTKDWLKVAKALNDSGRLDQIYTNIYRQTLDPALNPITQNDPWYTIHEFLEKLWFDAPDEPYIHGWRGWSDLCDLCSEVWVFKE